MGLGAAALLLLTTTAAAQDGFGGSRTNGLVRDQVRAGAVPSPEAFTVEGMLAEHHFPVQEERCPESFCVFTAMGHGLYRPSLKRSAYLLVEPISGLDPRTLERPAQNLAVVIDRSGSMNGWKLAAAREATHAIIDHLGPRDRLAIVTFDEQARLERRSAPVRDRAALHRIVDRIAAGGSTNLHQGLATGFRQVQAHGSESLAADRVFVFTDERPNVGETETGSFQELVGTFAAGRVGLSVIGVGLDLRAELASAMSQLEGGSYHYLEGPEGVPALFGDDFDAMLVPVAYRVRIEVRPQAGLRVAGVYGVPGDDVVLRGDGSATLRASTVFLDRRRSGAIVRLEPTGQSDAVATNANVRVRWSYVRPRDEKPVTGERLVSHRATVPSSLAEFADGHHYRAYALVNFAELFRAALRHWHGGRTAEALRVLGNARRALDIDTRILDDPQLATDRALADRVLATMRAHAPAAKAGR